MSEKDRRRRDNKSKIGRRRKSYLTVWSIGVMFGAALLFGVIYYWPQTEPWGLPAVPRNPRPATLPPELFTGKVAQVYRIAREVPELLDQMPCYCGCYVSDGHRNNLDCYTDRHSVG